MDKRDVIILLLIISLVIGPSLYLGIQKISTPPPPKVEQVIMTILDEGPNQDQILQTQYEEKNPKTIHLERTINWIEAEKVEQTIGFIETTELAIVDVTFTDTVGDGSGDDLIVVSFTNYGTKEATITQVNFNGVTQKGNWILTSGEDIIWPGDPETVKLTADWTKGNKYSIKFFAADGTLVGYYINATA